MQEHSQAQKSAKSRIKKRLVKLRAERRKIVRRAKARVAKAAAIEHRMDRLAVKIVTLVADKMTGGKLYAYSGIEASRAVRSLLMRTIAKRQ